MLGLGMASTHAPMMFQKALRPCASRCGRIDLTR
jgi:hypothetical protein